MSDQTEAIKSRIRKLLALANDSAAAEMEIEQALCHAQRLMDLHHVSEADLSPAEREERMARITTFTGSNKRQAWEGWLINAVCDALGGIASYWSDASVVRSETGAAVLGKDGEVRQAVSVTFFGAEEDCILARSVYDETRLTIATMGRLRWGGVYKGEGRSYCEGYVLGLTARLQGERKARQEAAAGADQRAIVLRRNDIVKAKVVKANAWLKDELKVKLGKGR